METFRKAVLQTITVPFDFSSFLNSVGHPFPSFSSTADLGIDTVDSVITDDVVTMSYAGGTDGSTYHVSVSCSSDSGSSTLTKQILVGTGFNSSLYADSYADGYA